MNPIYLRSATLGDLPTMSAIIQSAKELLKNDNIDQWQDGYPNLAQSRADVENKQAYVLMVNQQIGAMATFLTQPDPSYQTLRQGHWQQNGPYATFHRLAVNPEFRGQHLTNYLMSNLLTLAIQHDLANVRIDTHQDNLRMQHILNNWGFQKRGMIELQYQQGGVRVAYELNL
ncbi:GNAT family N-acetyltransferase [Bombilactobacillus thymidiniphilus]|uniref:GNAT family N-acetyltransferase n=1 Tax=Bombilactobacillus thymidiniphilus TaxID=2923363 RepID=A0ABY4PBH3_9LACO|nr:GNAT family N-acetyltransferase [Bombilactobacillus thymidiniphilus]UQS83018.1 GNAT family N-acetyltransferase [Bombilactobacillus thymidiniphilus]